jgi:hypothetical protein
MQYVKALGYFESVTRSHLEKWSLGIAYLEDMPCMGTARKLLTILNGCLKNMTS